MIKIIKNPNKIWEERTELNGQKYIFMTTDFTNKPAYAKIGLRSLFGYIVMRFKYGKRA
jgi:hypothetical protein